MTDFLDLDDLLEIAAGVLTQVQVRDPGLLASAAARPQQVVFGEVAYPNLSDQAAALMHALARNHALIDGNKRLAWSATRVFCLMNDHDLSFTSDAAERLVLAAATGERDVHEISAELRAHLVPAHDSP